MMSVGALILATSLTLGKMSSQEGQRVHVGFMTLMPVARGLCRMTPARAGHPGPQVAGWPRPHTLTCGRKTWSASALEQEVSFSQHHSTWICEIPAG